MWTTVCWRFFVGLTRPHSSHRAPPHSPCLRLGVDEHTGPSLHQIQATGAFQRYRAAAAGGGGAAANACLAASTPAAISTRTTATGEKAAREASRQRREGPLSGVDGVGGDDVKRAEEEGEEDRVVSDLEDHDGDATNGAGQAPVSKGERRVHPSDGTAASAGSGGGDDDQPDGEGEKGNTLDGADAWKTRPAAGRRTLYAQRPRWREGDDRPSLAPGHRTVLKRALSALWEADVGDYGSGRPARALAGSTGKGSEGERVGAHGGLRATQLSATVYGKSEALPSFWKDEDAGRGEEDEVAWADGFECSANDFEVLLLELEDEKREAPHKTSSG